MRKLEDLKKQAIDEIDEEKAEIRSRKEDVIKDRIKNSNKEIERFHKRIEEDKIRIKEIKEDIGGITEEDIENVVLKNVFTGYCVTGNDSTYIATAAGMAMSGCTCNIAATGKHYCE